MNLLPSEKFDRKILIRTDEIGEFGVRPEERSVARMLQMGIVNINKPKGPTSHQISAYVQKILKVKKSGHSGTLDPAVTGCLPIALGRSTKVVSAMIKSGKEYIALMHLHSNVDQNTIRKTFKKMTGVIKQLPPIKCAIKRQWRYRKVYYIEVLEIDGQDVLFKIGCEAGTYIRKYIHDFGQAVKCGAHMQQLVRSKASSFTEKNMISLQELTDAYHYYENDGDETLIRKYIRPVEEGVNSVAKVWISDSCVNSILNGVDLKVPGIVKVHSEIEPDQVVAVMTLKDELLGFGTAKLTSKKMIELEKGIAVIVNSNMY